MDDKVKEHLNQMIKNGLLFTFVTARDWESTYEIMKDININLPVAVFNGAVVIDFSSEKILSGIYISKESFYKIWKLASKNKMNLSVNYNSNISVKKKILESNNRQIESDISNINHVISCALVGTEKQILQIYYDIKKLKIKDIKINLYKDTLNKNVRIIDIVSIYSSKGHAVEQIKNLYGYHLIKYIVAFGNGENDIEMFKEADLGVGVGEIPDSLQMYTDLRISYDGGFSIIDYIEKSYKTRGGENERTYNGI